MMHFVLTGGIGSGKSTILAMFSDLGVPTFSADEAAKFAMQNNTEIRTKICALLGSQAYVDNRPNRPFIAEQVFANKEKLLALNAIVHPAAKRAYANWRKEQNAPYTMYEFPLVFELGAADRFDGVILVCSSEEERIVRVQKRDNISKEAVQARMANQWADEKKIPLANFIIENNSLENVKAKVFELHRQFVKRSKK